MCNSTPVNGPRGRRLQSTPPWRPHPPPHPLTGRLALPSVKQPAKAALLVTFPPPPHVPVADANDLRRLKPRNLLRHCLQHHFLYFHRPLHRGPQVRFHASHGLLLSPPAKRTYRVLTQPDISCANDTRTFTLLTRSVVWLKMPSWHFVLFFP